MAGLFSQLGDTSLPDQGPEPGQELPEELLRRLHHILLEVSLH